MFGPAANVGSTLAVVAAAVASMLLMNIVTALIVASEPTTITRET